MAPAKPRSASFPGPWLAWLLAFHCIWLSSRRVVTRHCCWNCPGLLGSCPPLRTGPRPGRS
eukprot:6991790-Lingulodinium_polyedra.AAC.1